MHIRMDDGGKGVPAPAVVADQARAAVEQFRRMQPTLSSYARALTGNPRARVVLGSATGGGGTHSTGDGTIHYTPPIQLGLPVEHDRSKCDRRNSAGLQSCPACRNRERVLASVYHEIAHFAFDSFLVLKDAHKQLMADGLRGVFGGERGERMATRLLAYYGRQTSQIAPIVDKRFFPLLNGLEDSRINAAMAAARPGTRAMTQANAVEAIEGGIEYIDSDGNKATAYWHQYPADLQVSLACHLYASGHDIKDSWFSPPIYLALADTELQGYLKQASTQNSVVGTFITAAMVFNRLQQVGFFEDPENPPLEQESQPEPDEQDSEPDPEPDEQEDDSDTDEDGDPSPSDEDGEESGDQESDDDADSTDGGGGSDDTDDDSDEGAGDTGSEPTDAESDADAGSGDEPGSPADDEGEGSEGDAPGEDEDRAADGAGSGDNDAESDEPEGSDQAGDTASEGEGDKVDDQADDASAPGESTEGDPGDGPEDTGDSTSGDPGETSEDAASDGDDVSPDEDGGQGSESDAGDLGTGAPERSMADSLEGEDDADQPGDSGEHDLQAEQEGDGDHAEGEPGPDSGPDEDDGQPESSEDVESGDDSVDPQQSTSSGDGRPSESDGPDDGLLDDEESAAPEQTDIESILDSLKAMPTPEMDPNPYEAAELMKQFMGHGEDDEPTLDEQLMIDNAMDQAINQAEHFDTPSKNLSMVNVKTFDQTSWWDARPPIVIPEVHLGAPLLHLRRVFTDNSRGHKQRNLKSGRVSSRVLGRRAVVADPRLFTKKSQPGKRDYFVVIGMDISGSMIQGKRLANELAAVAAQAELLTRLGVRFEVWAHTGSGLMTERGRHGTSTTAVEMHPVKLTNEPWDAIRKGRFAGLRPTGYNLDGHTLEFYRKRLDAVTATDKILMYYTDGDMPYANFTEELAVLKREIEICRKREYRLMGVGIETISPKAHGLDTVMIRSIRDLGKVITHLEKVLT